MKFCGDTKNLSTGFRQKANPYPISHQSFDLDLPLLGIILRVTNTYANDHDNGKRIYYNPKLYFN